MGGIAAASFILVTSLKMTIPYTPAEPDDSPPVAADVDREAPPPETVMKSCEDNSTTEYSSAEEISEAAGFEVEEFTDVPFETDGVFYQVYSDGTVEIVYTYDDQKLYYRKAEGSSYILSDDIEYEQTKEIEIHSDIITLKGDSRQCPLTDAMPLF